MQYFSSHGIKWAIAASCAFCSLPSGIHAAEPLPQRNLLIEWRVGGAGQRSEVDVGARTVVRGLAPGGYAVSTQSRRSQTTVMGVGGTQVETEGENQGVQQILVLNGGQAKLFVGSSQPYTVWQWSWGAGQGSSQGQTTQTGQGVSTGPATAGNTGSIAPAANANTTTSSNSSNSRSSSTSTQQGVQATSQTAYLDLGEGVTVRPRWPGGRAPVRVELEAHSRQAGNDAGRYGNMAPDGQVMQTEVATTLTVPLRQWVVVARRSSQVQVQTQGTGAWSASTRALDDTDSSLLEIRVSLP